MEHLYAQLNVEAMKKGVIKKVGGVKHFAVLASIASFVNSDGKAFPSQDTIAEMTGYSRKTIGSTIKELTATKIDGENVLTVTQVKMYNGRRNVYQLSPKTGFTFGQGVVTFSSNLGKYDGKGDVNTGSQELEPMSNKNQEEQEQEIVFDNARDVVKYFAKKFQEHFDTPYNPTWGREVNLVKNKMISTYTDAQIKTIIDVAVTNYETKWANPKFPRPTIGQVATWLGMEALALSERQAKESHEIKQDAAKYEFDDAYYDKIMKNF